VSPLATSEKYEMKVRPDTLPTLGKGRRERYVVPGFGIFVGAIILLESGLLRVMFEVLADEKTKSQLGVRRALCMGACAHDDEERGAKVLILSKICIVERLKLPRYDNFFS
jgi:hypothetical protein